VQGREESAGAEPAAERIRVGHARNCAGGCIDARAF
jgi:hypothetical protein